jgi:hypothetical protein
MKKVLLAAAALACIGGTALAGPNANGSLILVLADGVVYTTDIESYCGASGLHNCADGITSANTADTVVLNVLAAFPSVASPRLAAVSFGWSYGADVNLVASGNCGDFELGTADWPGSGAGNAVTFAVPQTNLITDVYWVAAYTYYGSDTNPQAIVLGEFPGQGANFADDDIPANVDPIAGLGAFGFYQDGALPCPPDVAPGACCDLASGDCIVVLRDECDALGFEFLGDGTSCDPNPCPQPATGACCVLDVCSIRSALDCANAGGDYVGDDVPCDPNPCVIPTLDKSWGEI